MRYTVIWLAPALEKLAELWTDTSNRELIAKAADEIDLILQRSPQEAGESREGTVRILLFELLAVYFAVFEADRRVLVWDVWKTRR